MKRMPKIQSIVQENYIDKFSSLQSFIGETQSSIPIIISEANKVVNLAKSSQGKTERDPYWRGVSGGFQFIKTKLYPELNNCNLNITCADLYYRIESDTETYLAVFSNSQVDDVIYQINSKAEDLNVLLDLCYISRNNALLDIFKHLHDKEGDKLEHLYRIKEHLSR